MAHTEPFDVVWITRAGEFREHIVYDHAKLLIEKLMEIRPQLELTTDDRAEVEYGLSTYEFERLLEKDKVARIMCYDGRIALVPITEVVGVLVIDTYRQQIARQVDDVNPPRRIGFQL